MNKLVPTAITSMSLLMLLGASPSTAAQQCADVENAKVALRSTGLSSSRSQDVQSPRNPQSTRQDGNLAGARNQDVQSPRNQDVQAPRNQDIQSPRSQDVQSPRNQDIQSPRGATAQQQRAVKLVNEASAACDAGNTSVASQKAREAMALLRK